MGKIASKLKTNMLIFFLAIVLSFVLFFFVKNPSFFQSNVLLISDQELLSRNRDVGYKLTHSQELDIYVSDKLKKLWNFHLLISYREWAVVFSWSPKEVQWTYKLISDANGEMLIEIEDISEFKYNESLFVISYEWNASDVVLSEVKIKDGPEERYLSIGSFDDIEGIHRK